MNFLRVSKIFIIFNLLEFTYKCSGYTLLSLRPPISLNSKYAFKVLADNILNQANLGVKTSSSQHSWNCDLVVLLVKQLKLNSFSMLQELVNPSGIVNHAEKLLSESFG